MRTQMHQKAYLGQDIGDRPLPEVSVPGLIEWLAALRGVEVNYDFDLDNWAIELAPELEASEPPEARGLARDEVRLVVHLARRVCGSPRWPALLA